MNSNIVCPVHRSPSRFKGLHPIKIIKRKIEEKHKKGERGCSVGFNLQEYGYNECVSILMEMEYDNGIIVNTCKYHSGVLVYITDVDMFLEILKMMEL